MLTPSPETKLETHRLPWSLRVLSLFAGCCVLALLVTSRFLEPDPSGLGTHQQLGLPPCTSIMLFNAPCPACGMTTSWAWIARAQFGRAIQANLGGALLAIIGMAYLPASCYFFLRGTSSQREWFSLTLSIALVIAIAAASAQWYLRWN